MVLDDQVVGQLNLTVQPGQPATAALAITPKKAGLLRGRFELPPDAFPDDNTYLFCLNVEPHDSRAADYHARRYPAGRSGHLSAAALASPLLAKGQANEQDQHIARSLLVTAIRSDQFNESQLEKTDVIVAADMADGRSARRCCCGKHLERGGGLLMFAGPHVDPGRYTAGAVQRHGSARAPARRSSATRRPSGNPDDESTFQAITFVDNQHPALTQFERGDVDYFGMARLYRYLPLTLSSPRRQLATSAGRGRGQRRCGESRPPVRRR